MLQQGQAASVADLKKVCAGRNPAPPACAPPGLSRTEGRHSPLPISNQADPEHGSSLTCRPSAHAALFASSTRAAS
jgi:hypothetical protein